MKPQEITTGKFKFGHFVLYINLPVFSADLPEDSSYFLVLAREAFKTKDVEYLSPVDLINDERFQIFKHVGDLSQTLQEDDLIAYNHYVMRKNIADHPIKLSRFAIANLISICKKAKKKKLTS